MAVGKTTAGRELASRLGWPFLDSDADLTATRGITGRELAEREGVGALHRWEAEHLLRTLASPRPVVVAAAASVVDDAACRAALRRPFVVWLRAPAGVLERRMEGDDRLRDHRRRLGGATAVRELEARRAGRFAAVADLVVDIVVDGVALRPDEIVTAILDQLPAPPGGAPGRR
jgi:shikimate kinase